MNKHMGLTIRCGKTGRSMDMGGGGFLRLRRKVAELAGGPFVPVYQEVCAWYPGSNGETAEEFDARIGKAVNEMLAAKQADLKIVDFLLQSDIEGRIRYGACKKILKVIGDYDDDVFYGYVGHGNRARFRQFRRILKDCVETKSDLVWR